MNNNINILLSKNMIIPTKESPKLNDLNIILGTYILFHLFKQCQF
jgi:hypothetical protein